MRNALQALDALDERRGSYLLREKLRAAGDRRALEVQLDALEALSEVEEPARSVRALAIVIDIDRGG